MKDYTLDVIKEVTNRYLSEVLLSPPESPEKLTKNRIDSRRRQAKRIAESEMFTWACSVVINDAAQKILRDSDNNILRGKILGIGELIGLLNNWKAAASLSDEYDERADAVKNIIKEKNGIYV